MPVEIPPISLESSPSRSNTAFGPEVSRSISERARALRRALSKGVSWEEFLGGLDSDGVLGGVLLESLLELGGLESF